MTTGVNDQAANLKAAFLCRQRTRLAKEVRILRLAEKVHDLNANVPDQVSLLAFGAKACLAGDVPKVPKGQGLTASVCSV